MNILHIVSGELTGGAARGAYWLHRGLNDLGCNTYLINNSRLTINENRVSSIRGGRLDKFSNLIRPYFSDLPLYLYPKREKWIFSTGFSGSNFLRHPFYKAADIVHLHWICGLVSIKSLSRLDKPVVWTLRDMWPMTGGCHYTMSCTRYQEACGLCPQLHSNYKNDLSSFVLRNKRSFLPKKLCIVGVSSWLSECASKSSLFRNNQIETIGNNVPADQFKPIAISVARAILGLSQDKKILLIGAQSIHHFYKSPELLYETISKIAIENLHILVFGASNLNFGHLPESSVTYMGYLGDIFSLRLVYSASDVFLATSRMDAFPKTTIESMSCGTPVACFDSTGFVDIVDHLVTGYKAKPFDANDLAYGVGWLLSLDMERRMAMREASRRRVCLNFDSKVIARKYLSLYQRLLA
jgi:glycosyltransferase involved in cell wall biosynthesis